MPEDLTRDLARLKEVDPETYEQLRNYPIYVLDDSVMTINLLESKNELLVCDCLTGCLQRACEQRGWVWMVKKHVTGIHDAEITWKTGKTWKGSKGLAAFGHSPAHALLSAYLEAICKT